MRHSDNELATEPLGIVRVRCSAGQAYAQSVVDLVTREQALLVRVSGDDFLTTMRTPGADVQLVAGLLLSEGLIKTRADLASISHCGPPSPPTERNTVNVVPAPGFDFPSDLEVPRLVQSACGVCGRESIEKLLADVTPLRFLGPKIEPTWLLDSLQSMTQQQGAFAASGAIHAAALCSPTHEAILLHEDVGRHNAVDKVLGANLIATQLPASEAVLLVSGRVSFEIVQKACRSQVAVVAGISGPTTLAVETAQTLGVTLVGFARQERLNVYSHPERLCL